MAYFKGEPAGQKVLELLKESASRQRNLLLSVVNWGEVLYSAERLWGLRGRDETAHRMRQMHLDVIPADQEIAEQAARYKAAGKISYADCFAAALTKLRNATLVTGDKEFKAIEKEIKILWL